MEVTIQCIKFDATDKLRDYINKKMSKLDKFFDRAPAPTADPNATKPDSVDHTEPELPNTAPNAKLIASKTANSFEQAVDECISALERQVEKNKNKGN